MSKKIVSFFMNKYYNNLKYNNSIISTSRIFFERTTKNILNIAKLGNVYRNSKWTDLRVSNIGTNWFNQFYTSITSICCFVVATFLLKFVLLTNYSIYFNFSNLYIIMMDTFSYAFLLILSVIYSLYQKLNFYMLKYTRTSFNKLHAKSPEVLNRESYRYLKYIPDGGTTKDQTIYHSWFLKRLLKNINNADANLIRYPLKDLHSFINKLEFNQNFTTSRYTKSAELSSIIFTIPTNPLEIRNLGIFPSKLFTINTSLNLSTVKQMRWFFKSSLLSDKINKKNLEITNVKQLYGNPLTLNMENNRSIWLSNKMNSGLNFIKINELYNQVGDSSNLFTRTELLLKSNLGMSNYFEKSSIWSVKRFKFTQIPTFIGNFIDLSNIRARLEIIPQGFNESKLFFYQKNLIKNFINLTPLNLYNYKTLNYGAISTQVNNPISYKTSTLEDNSSLGYMELFFLNSFVILNSTETGLHVFGALNTISQKYNFSNNSLVYKWDTNASEYL